MPAAGSDAAYGFGDSESEVGGYAWHEGDSGERTHSVGGKRPNAWGLYDMHGNVVEWCADWYDEGYYSRSPATDPAGAPSGRYRVLRGGSWYYVAYNCRSACRNWFAPVVRLDYFGFRVSSGTQ